jgi:hypothetical protein
MKEFEKMMKGWNKLALELSDYGAFDTEPRQVMEFVIEKFIDEGKELLPLTASKWQLYTASMCCEDAAHQLNEYTQKIIDLINGMKYSEVMEIKEYYGY